MRSITTIVPTTPVTFIIGFLVAFLLLAAPAPAKAVTVDDLLTQVQSMMEQMAKMQIQLQELKSGQSTTVTPATTAPTGSVLGAKTFKFTEPVEYGADNDDVFKIQQLLKLDKEIYPDGTVSGFFGPKTQEAIRNLQKKFGLDPVGVVGPATTALLERLISQQNSDGTYPADILDPARPTGSVLGESTSTVTDNPLVQQLLEQVKKLQTQQTSGNSTSNSNSNSSSANTSNIDEIKVAIDDAESNVKVFYKNGDIKDFWVSEDEKDKIIEAIADKLGVSESLVEDLAGFGKKGSGSSDDDVEEIYADVDIEDEETKVEVVFDGGDEDDFTVDSSDYDDIIEEIADELDIDEDDVLDIIEWDWNIDADDIDEIKVDVEDKEAEVTVELESGDEIEFTLDEDDEDDIIELIAEILDIDEDDVEDLLDIDFAE